MTATWPPQPWSEASMLWAGLMWGSSVTARPQSQLYEGDRCTCETSTTSWFTTQGQVWIMFLTVLSGLITDTWLCVLVGIHTEKWAFGPISTPESQRSVWTQRRKREPLPNCLEVEWQKNVLNIICFYFGSVGGNEDCFHLLTSWFCWFSLDASKTKCMHGLHKFAHCCRM